MSHWPCSVSGCDKGALLSRPATCKHCIRHFCFDHVSDNDKHPCSGRDPELRRKGDERGDHAWDERQQALLAKIDVQAMIEEAEQLRPGHACHGPSRIVKGGQDVIINGGNIHIVLTFDDGVKWLARIKQGPSISPPPHVQKLEKLSEMATFKVLHDAGILVPRVWGRPRGGQANDLNYFFVEFVPGTAYKGFNGFPTITRSPTDRELVIIESYAKFQLSLEKVTFTSIGSPTFDPSGKIIIGPIISSFAPLAQPPYYLGPFFSPKQRYLAFFDMVMTAVMENRWCAPEKSVLTYQGMLEAKMLVETCKELGEDSGPFYIKHGEAKCDHFLLDKCDNITAMLDWEWSYTTSKADAFAAPLGFVAKEFFRGNNNLSLLEIALAAAYRRLGRDDLAGFVEQGKRYQWLDFLLHGLHPSFQKLAGLRPCVDHPQEDWPTRLGEWNGYVTAKYKDHEGVAKLQAAEQARRLAAAK